MCSSVIWSEEERRGVLGVRVITTSFNMERSFGALFNELQCIWTEIGESEADKNRMLLEMERECLQVYQRKVDQAGSDRARLHRTVAAKEAELAALMASLGEHTYHSKTDKTISSLKEQLASVTPRLEDLKLRKKERVKQFADIHSQIEKINADLTELMYQEGAVMSASNIEENDLSVRKLNEYQAQLHALKKEKSDRLQKVLEHVNEVHSLCGVLGLEFKKTVDEVHPSLHETDSGKFANISDRTLEGLAQTIAKLKTEKKTRFYKLQETVKSLFEFWNLMEPTEQEKRRFGRLACVLGSSEQNFTYPGLLSLDTMQQTEAEVERLKKLKASKMKELVLKRRSELEEICRRAHLEPNMDTTPEKSSAMIDSGLVDPSELVANIDAQIVKVKEETRSRKDIMDRIDKWLTACEEENWLEDYNHDVNRYSAGRGAHLNLKRAEKARMSMTKIPAIVDNLINRTFAWENERNMRFLYDGVPLVAILEEYKLTRVQKEEEKKRFREHKKLQGLLLTEKESVYGSKPSPKRSNSFNRNRNRNGCNASINGNSGFMTPTTRRFSAGSVTSELLTPRSYSGHQNGYFKETSRLSTTSLNYVSLSKDNTSSSFTSISGSEPESPFF